MLNAPVALPPPAASGRTSDRRRPAAPAALGFGRGVKRRPGRAASLPSSTPDLGLEGENDLENRFKDMLLDLKGNFLRVAGGTVIGEFDC